MPDNEQRRAIDSVPLLAVIDATWLDPEADALWDRAIEYERAISADPDFQGASQQEIYEEVGRRLEAFLGPDGVAEWLEEPASESELDRLNALPTDELEAVVDQAASNGRLDRLLSGALGAE